HEVRDRRALLMHPRYAAPELLATAPNQLWSWDITKLKGPTTWSYFYLYVIIDVFSRRVVGWMLAPNESATLAEKLIEETCEQHHSGLGLNTPNDVHYGRAQQRREERARVLVAAHTAHPERFVRGVPQPPQLPTAVWINKPVNLAGLQ